MDIQETNKMLAKGVWYLLKDAFTGTVVSDSNGKLYSIFRDGNALSFAEVEDKNIKEGMLLKFNDGVKGGD